MSQANWKTLSNPNATIGYQDLAPLLNQAHHHQAKGLTRAIQNIEDEALIHAHLALLNHDYTAAHHHLQSTIVTPRNPLETQLFFDVYRKSHHVIQALWYADAQKGANLLDLQPISALQKLPPFNEETSLWRDLFLTLKNHQQSPEHFYEQLSAFKKEHPSHPATQLLTLTQPISSETMVKMGVLLPLSGPISEVGQSIREGIMAAHFNHPLNKNWTLIFFDTHPTPLSEILRSGQNNKITHWIGPLDKVSAQAFTRIAPNSDNILLLNSVDSQPPLTRSFIISPEYEATQVSDHLIKNGYHNIMIIEGHHPWSARQVEAFTQAFTRQGGHIVEKKKLSEHYAKDIKELLRIPDSRQAYQQLQTQTRSPIKFLASSRQDIDAIFLATSHEEALQVKPLLKLNLTQSYVPIFATSSIISDRSAVHKNKDLDDIIFCDTMIPSSRPSASVLESNISALMNELQSTHSKAFPDFQRFYALGIDAYHLQLYKHYMDSVPSIGIPSASGKRLIRQGNQIKTELYWGKYRQGRQVNITHELD